MFSVNTEKEAKILISKCCEKVTYGKEMQVGYLARELEQEQSLANLQKFHDKLEQVYQDMQKQN